MDIKEFKLVCGLILFFIIVVGIIGNALSLIIWSNGKRCKTLPGSIYLIALAVSDNFVLCLTATYYAVEFVFDIHLTNLNLFLCKFLNTTWHFTLLVSTWIVVCLTVERVIAVRWPLKASRWTNKKQSVIVITAVVIITFLPNLPWTIGNVLLPANHNAQKNLYGTTFQVESNFNASQDEPENNGTKDVSAEDDKLTCQSDPASFIFRYETEWHKWFIDFGLLYSVPLLIITTCNVLILTTVCRRHNRLTTRDSQSHSKKRHTVSQAMTARVVAISFVHCLSVGPYSIAVLIPEFIQNVNKITYITCLFIIFTFIWYINHAVNFVLYSLFGTAFRKDCYRLFCKRDTHDEHGTELSNYQGTDISIVSSGAGD